MCGPEVGCVNVDVLKIGNVAGRYAVAMGLGGACDEGIIQFQRASGTLRLYSELGCPLRRGPVRGQDAILNSVAKPARSACRRFRFRPYSNRRIL